MAEQQAPPLQQLPIGSVRPPREPLSYVLPTICRAELGTLRFRGPGYYMPLHPGWCPKYVILYLDFFLFSHLIW
jgi:hypothetical protein